MSKYLILAAVSGRINAGILCAWNAPKNLIYVAWKSGANFGEGVFMSKERRFHSTEQIINKQRWRGAASIRGQRSNAEPSPI